MTDRGRLIPAVILGALGLLTLKLIGWSQGPVALTEPVPVPVAVSKHDPSQYQGFTKFVAKSRAPYVGPDPETTGSVPDKDKDKAKDAKDAKESKAKDSKAKPDKAAEAELEKLKAAEAKKAADTGPRDAAKWLNGAERPLSPSERALMDRLGERREEMDGRLKELEMREKLLESVERKIESRTDELKKLEDKTNESANEKAKQEQQGLRNLVIMYEAMKPKDAARIFDRLSHDVLVPVVQQMNPRKMSEVLSSMQPEAAEKLTVAIASRALKPGTDQRALAPASAVPGLPAGELQALPPPARP